VFPPTGEMMSFIKTGDGKIMSVIDEEELTDAQKKSARDLSKQNVKTSDADASSTKKLEN
jgi:hypothetical protein